MLFSNWRNENDITNDDTSKIQRLYENKIDEILYNRKKYIYSETIETEMEDGLQDIQNKIDNEINDDVPNKNDCVVDALAIYEINQPATDIRLEIPNNFNTVDIVQNIKLPRQISNDEYYALIRQLNDKQYRYHHNFTCHLRNNSVKKVYHFVSGSPGVGKSKLIDLITQTIIRHYNNIAGNNIPEKLLIISMV